MTTGEHSTLMKSFFLNRTQLAQDDKGSFLALREFNEVSDYLAVGGHMKSAQTFSGGHLDQQFGNDRRQDLPSQTAISSGSRSAAAIHSAGAAGQAAVSSAAGAAGVDVRAPLERPTDLTVQDGQPMRGVAEIQRDVREGANASKTRNDEEKTRLDGLMEQGLKSAPTDGFFLGPNDIAEIDRNHRPMPDVRPPAPPKPSPFDKIPSKGQPAGPAPDRSAVEQIPTRQSAGPTSDRSAVDQIPK